MSRQITVDLVSDTKDFERSMKASGDAVESFESDLKSADNATSRFDDGLDKTTAGLENTTGKLRSTNDLVSGFADVVGLSLPPQAQMIVGFADMADGMSGLLGPALKSSKAAFASMNATMMANPMFLIIAATVAVAAALAVLYVKVEWFRNGVNAAFGAIKNTAVGFKDTLVNSVEAAARVLGGVADLILEPYRFAFRQIAWLWNNTVGKLSFSIPGWVPGVGGKGFDVPDIPQLAKGGIVNSPTLALIGEAGPEAVVPLSRGGGAGGFGGSTTIVIQTGASDLDELIRKRVRVLGNGSVQRAYGFS